MEVLIYETTLISSRDYASIDRFERERGAFFGGVDVARAPPAAPAGAYWSSDWYIWYFLRPLVSVICGGVSSLFLKAGLLILESRSQEGASEIGYYALAFIAGLNVDKFVAKIEDIAQAVWGIEKSRVAKGNFKDDE